MYAVIFRFAHILLILSNIFIFCECFAIAEESSDELNTILMRSTYKIEGISKEREGALTTGTVFMLGRPSRIDSKYLYFVLVTATHVLDGIKGDKATLYLRKKIDNSYEKIPTEIPIRKENKDLWVRHSEVDVSAMYVHLPKDIDISLLSINFLADDGVFKDVELHPGDELLCLGYPFSMEANQAGFPILRSGKIASFPILPTKEVKSFLYDFEVFGRNSGGPVYFIQTGRFYRGEIHVYQKNQFIVGLVSEERIIVEKNVMTDEYREKQRPLKLAVVIPASFIKETIELLPSIE